MKVRVQRENNGCLPPFPQFCASVQGMGRGRGSHLDRMGAKYSGPSFLTSQPSLFSGDGCHEGLTFSQGVRGLPGLGMGAGGEVNPPMATCSGQAAAACTPSLFHAGTTQHPLGALDMMEISSWPMPLPESAESSSMHYDPLLPDLSDDDNPFDDDLDLSGVLSMGGPFEGNADLNIVDSAIFSLGKARAPRDGLSANGIGIPLHSSTPEAKNNLASLDTRNAIARELNSTDVEKPGGDPEALGWKRDAHGAGDVTCKGQVASLEGGHSGRREPGSPKSEMTDADSWSCSAESMVCSPNQSWSRPQTAVSPRGSLDSSIFQVDRVERKAGEPKRPMNGFIRFSLAYRQKIAKLQPKVDNREVSKMCGMEWRRMSEEKRKPFENEFWVEMDSIRAQNPDWNYSPKGRLRPVLESPLPSRLRPRDKLKPRFQLKATRKYMRRKREGIPDRRRTRPRELPQDTWVQCDHCQKWRRLPCPVNPNSLSQTEWYCSYNPDMAYNSCDIPAEEYMEEERGYSEVSCDLSLPNLNDLFSLSSSQTSNDAMMSFGDCSSPLNHSFQ